MLFVFYIYLFYNLAFKFKNAHKINKFSEPKQSDIRGLLEPQAWAELH